MTATTMPAPLTADTITDDTIRALRDEAGEAGDLDMVKVCDMALDGATPENRRACHHECAKAINNARAMDDYADGADGDAMSHY